MMVALETVALENRALSPGGVVMTFLRPVALAFAAALSNHAAALQLIDVPTGLAWSAEEVSGAGPGAATILARTAAAGQSDCRTHCEAIQRVWLRLVDVMAGQQQGRAKPFVLTLHVVQADDVDAFAAPDGTLVLSEEFVRRRHLDDAQLAFVLSHEAAHTLFEHERQALTAALLLLPATCRARSRTSTSSSASTSKCSACSSR